MNSGFNFALFGLLLSALSIIIFNSNIGIIFFFSGQICFFSGVIIGIKMEIKS